MTISYDTSLCITEVAAFAPIGAGFAAFKKGLRRSEHRFGPVSEPLKEEWQGDLFGAELTDFEPAEILGRKGLRHKDRNALILLCCMQMDLAETLQSVEDPHDVGLAVGTTFGSLGHQIDFTRRYVRDGFRALNAMQFPNMVINVPPSQANIWFNLTHSSTTISNGFTAGLDAIVFAADAILVGRAQRIIAGGSEDFLTQLAAGFKRRGWSPEAATVTPFSPNQSGTLLGEGAGLVMLESEAAAKQRGAAIRARILGYGSSLMGHSIGATRQVQRVPAAQFNLRLMQQA